MADPDVVLDVAGLSVRRGSGEEGFVLRIDRFSLRRGGTVAVVGPSGSGKSTLLDTLALLRRPAEGPDRFAVRKGDRTIELAELLRRWDASALALRRRRLFGYVLQQGALLPFVSVRHNILLAAGSERRSDAAEPLEALATSLEIDELLDRYPGQLSVGQRQRVAIARALYPAPPLVLADEPTAALDPANAASVANLLVESARESGAALVVATHDPVLAARMAARAPLKTGGGGSTVTFKGP